MSDENYRNLMRQYQAGALDASGLGLLDREEDRLGIRPLTSGHITKSVAIWLGEGNGPVYLVDTHYSRGLWEAFFTTNGMPREFRITGRCKTWVTRPDEFRLPYSCGPSGRRGVRGYITEMTAEDFTTTCPLPLIHAPYMVEICGPGRNKFLCKAAARMGLLVGEVDRYPLKVTCEECKHLLKPHGEHLRRLKETR
jgi:hypothetical protein